MMLVTISFIASYHVSFISGHQYVLLLVTTSFNAGHHAFTAGHHVLYSDGLLIFYLWSSHLLLLFTHLFDDGRQMATVF